MISLQCISKKASYKHTKRLYNILKKQMSTVSNQSEYTDVAQYPEIVDLSSKMVKLRKKQDFYDKIQHLKTVEEKLFAINMPKYYGWKCFILNEGVYPYSVLQLYQYITKTKLYILDGNSFNRLINTNDVKGIADQVKPKLQEVILFELNRQRHEKQFEKDVESQNSYDLASRSMIQQINRVILSNLSLQCNHLLESMVDYNPRIEAFWNVGKFYPSEEECKKREIDRLETKIGDRRKLTVKELENQEPLEETLDHNIQYYGKPALNLRCEHPLSVLHTEILDKQTNQVDVNENKIKKYSDIPKIGYDPTLTHNLEYDRKFGTYIPGFWPGDRNEFGLLSYCTRSWTVDRPPQFGQVETNETLHAQAIISSFSWLLSQAAYQGFSTFHELTYPFVNQCIITDGKLFSFYRYQLNTSLIHTEHLSANDRINICFGLPTSSLYQSIEGNSFVGWNDDVLATLISFYINEPKIRTGVDLSPHVDKSERYLSHITDDERRIWLHNQFRHMYCNRPRHKLLYEIYDWERIYKIRFPTRAIEPRRRPFDFDKNPIEDRKYYDHMHKYIKRSFTEKRKKHWTGWRSRFEKTYYPNVC